LVLAAAATLAVLAPFIPSQRNLGRSAALAASILVGLQLAVDHWFYLYLPWVAGLVLAGVVLAVPPATERETYTAQSRVVDSQHATR
jgi:hypothetical protein